MIGQFYHTLITGGLFPHFHAPHTFEYKVLGEKNVIRGNTFKSTSADFGQAVHTFDDAHLCRLQGVSWEQYYARMVSKYTRKKEEMKVLQSTGFTNTSDIGNVFCMSALSFKDSVQFKSIL